MIKSLILSLLFLFSFVNAQKESVIVEYNFLRGSYSTEASNNYLYIDDEQKLFLLYGIAGTNIRFEDLGQNFDSEKVGGIVEHLPNNTFLYTWFMTPPEKFYTKDVAPKINWHLKQEVKNILGYECQKAEGIFRGRKWTAWFTTKIPMQYGPWKIVGLPGLVLEAYSNEDEFKYSARRIIVNSNLKIPEEFFHYMEEKKKNLVSFKQYIEKENEFLRYQINEQLASMPSGTTLVEKSLRHAQPETILEWETEKEESAKP